MDEDRRTKLRAFLINCRSRLRPHDVGLPTTANRRVTGLRREEVAELIGVSSDWYRWFESGRPIRVSVPFLAKLCQALQLTPIEQINLYNLALPEIYAAYMAHRTRAIPSTSAKPAESIVAFR
jgi:transcriptional regulator with XRE-family HTH domain